MNKSWIPLGGFSGPPVWAVGGDPQGLSPCQASVLYCIAQHGHRTCRCSGLAGGQATGLQDMVITEIHVSHVARGDTNLHVVIETLASPPLMRPRITFSTSSKAELSTAK